MATRRCKIHYRQLSREGGQFPDETLSKALSGALNQPDGNGTLLKDNWRARVQLVGNGLNHYRFLNDFHDDGESFFGNVCLFSPGQLQALIEEEPEAPVLDIAERRAPDGSEYLHGICYWLAVDDHFLVVQHVALQSKAMESYFEWLLREQAGVIDEDHSVELKSVFDRNLVGGDLGDISSVEVGGVMPETIGPELAAAEGGGKVVEYKAKQALGEKFVNTFSKGKEILEAAIGTMETEQIIKSMPDEAALEVNVNFGFRATKRKFKREALSNLEASLRNMPDGEVRVRSKDGRVVGNDARLHHVMPIELVRENSSLLDNGDARDQMKEVYRRFLEDGRIVN
ncbi:MAG: hypothetical protein QNJ30_27660 [Kiloniellales bacterium]|nr:hypothetical protein [Kiloniellales bacterium]